MYTCGVCTCVCVFRGIVVEVREQFMGIVSILLPLGFWGSNSSCQVWQQADLLRSHQPTPAFGHCSMLSVTYVLGCLCHCLGCRLDVLVVNYLWLEEGET